MQSGNGKGFIVIGAFVLLLFFLYVKSNEGTEVGSYEPPTTSWIDNLLGNDDDMESVGGGGGEGGGFYLSSLFAGFEFRFKVKDYRAMSDDDLGEADDGL